MANPPLPVPVKHSHSVPHLRTTGDNLPHDQNRGRTLLAGSPVQSGCGPCHSLPSGYFPNLTHGMASAPYGALLAAVPAVSFFARLTTHYITAHAVRRGGLPPGRPLPVWADDSRKLSIPARLLRLRRSSGILLPGVYLLLSTIFAINFRWALYSTQAKRAVAFETGTPKFHARGPGRGAAVPT